VHPKSYKQLTLVQKINHEQVKSYVKSLQLNTKTRDLTEATENRIATYTLSKVQKMFFKAKRRSKAVSIQRKTRSNSLILAFLLRLSSSYLYDRVPCSKINNSAIQ